MQVSLNTESPTPLFAQLVEQIKAAVQAAQLKPGDPLPSIRQLSNDLNLNNKTIAKAYRLLERDGVIVTRGYRGTFIHADAVSNSVADMEATLDDTIGQAIAACRANGATDSEIRIAFGKAMQAPPDSNHSRRS